MADSTQGSLVDHVGEVCARGARSRTGNLGKVDPWLHLYIVCMQLQDRFATGEVRQLNRNTAVETPGTQKGGVKGVRTVRCTEHDDTLVIIEAVHLCQKLVERLFALIIRVNRHVATLADRIDFIDENDAGSLLFGLLK